MEAGSEIEMRPTRVSFVCFAILLVPVFAAPRLAQNPGRVLSHQKISSLEGGFSGPLSDLDFLGFSMSFLGDHDGDGVADLVSGAAGDGDGGSFRGAVWILFMQSDGTVRAHQKISDTQGNFLGTLRNGDQFGSSVAALGDLDGDGVGDLAVGTFADVDGGVGRGAVWILFLELDGTVKAHQKISSTEGGFAGALQDRDNFGTSVASLGDHDGDGVGDIAVGASGSDDEGEQSGAVWILYLNTDGTVKSHGHIPTTGFQGQLTRGDGFGSSVAFLGDLDGDGIGDLAVGAEDDTNGGIPRGAVWILFLNVDGSVKGHQKVSAADGGFDGEVAIGDRFGSSLAALGDIEGDGVSDLAVGAHLGDNGGTARGAMWILFLRSDGTVKGYEEISNQRGGFEGQLDDADQFGLSVARLGDLDGDGRLDLAVGAPGDDDGGEARGAVWNLFLDGFPSFPASSIVRNGSGINPLGFTEMSASIIGTTWSTCVDISAAGATMSLVSIGVGPMTVPTPMGEFLVCPPLLGMPNLGMGAHAIAIPRDVSLVGLTLYSQAATYTFPGILSLTNAIDITIGTH